MRKLMNFYAANKGRGAPLALSASDDDAGILEVYDMIVASEADAAWFGGVSAEAFTRAVRNFKGQTLHVRVNSPGGDVFAGVAMAQALRETSARVVLHVDGYAASAASLLVVAADEAVIAPGGMVMIHKAWTIALGNADDFRGQADLLDKIDGEIANSYATKAGGDKDKWLDLMAAETWFTGAEAVEAGLVDSVAEAPKKAMARFDMSAFDRAPAEPAEPVDVSAAAAAIAEAATQANEIERKRAKARATLLQAA